MSPLVVKWIISMSVSAVQLLTSSNANGCSCISLYYVSILLGVLLYRILRPMIFIPRFAEIWGPTFMNGSARALYRALVRPEGRAFLSDFSAESEDCHSASVPLRCTPSERQSYSIHNSLRLINPAAAGCSLQKPTGLLAYRSQALET